MSSPAISSNRLLMRPRPMITLNSPSADAITVAAELPSPCNCSPPLSVPSESFMLFTFGISFGNCICCSLMSSAKRAGCRRASSFAVPASLPPAAAKSIGSTVSEPSSSTRCAFIDSSGSREGLISAASSVTSASMARRRRAGAAWPADAGPWRLARCLRLLLRGRGLAFAGRGGAADEPGEVVDVDQLRLQHGRELGPLHHRCRSAHRLTGRCHPRCR